MIAYIFAIAVLALAFFFYQKILIPSRLKAHYAKSYRSQGYKVLELPFKFMGAPFFEMLAKAEQENGDPLYHHRGSLQQYDMVVTNLLSHVEIVFLN